MVSWMRSQLFGITEQLTPTLNPTMLLTTSTEVID